MADAPLVAHPRGDALAGRCLVLRTLVRLLLHWDSTTDPGSANRDWPPDPLGLGADPPPTTIECRFGAPLHLCGCAPPSAARPEGLALPDVVGRRTTLIGPGEGLACVAAPPPRTAPARLGSGPLRSLVRSPSLLRGLPQVRPWLRRVPVFTS